MRNWLATRSIVFQCASQLQRLRLFIALPFRHLADTKSEVQLPRMMRAVDPSSVLFEPSNNGRIGVVVIADRRGVRETRLEEVHEFLVDVVNTAVMRNLH